MLERGSSSTLSSCVPQGELDVLSINLDIRDIVLKDCGDIILWELSANVDNQKRGLSTSSISHNHKFALHVSFSTHYVGFFFLCEEVGTGREAKGWGARERRKKM